MTPEQTNLIKINPENYLENNVSKMPAIELLKAMGYIYISPEIAERKEEILTM